MPVWPLCVKGCCERLFVRTGNFVYDNEQRYVRFCSMAKVVKMIIVLSPERKNPGMDQDFLLWAAICLWMSQAYCSGRTGTEECRLFQKEASGQRCSL